MAEIRRAGPSDIDACESVLAMAFQDDPGMIHIEPDIARRADLLPAFFRTFLSASLAENGDLVVAGDPIDGIASWFGPEQHGPSPDAMGANGIGDVLALAGSAAADRLLAMVDVIERQHTALARGPHLRLEFYGVVPARQGSGIGTALIEHGHRRADDLGVLSYLETFTEGNVGFYRRRGYEVAGEFTVGEGTHGWGMIRQPQTG
jgi:GNAT superfamily N-acetyltransferase